jgi:hypothetical protein
MVKMTADERQRRRKKALRYLSNGMGVRMSWGSKQEATALLTALNYLCRKEAGVRLKEVGMCGAGLSYNTTNYESALLIGASPDALISYPDGKVEVLEVKNHCPFVSATWRSSENGFVVREMEFRQPYVQPQYVPQMMMEMLCVGPECRSAIMVRQTATTGALILRLYRDDIWIEEMLFWLNKFQREYVEKGVAPPPNFFWNDETHGERYQKFVQRTKELGYTVKVLEHIAHRKIQRMVGMAPNTTPLFLD